MPNKDELTKQVQDLKAQLQAAQTLAAATPPEPASLIQLMLQMQQESNAKAQAQIELMQAQMKEERKLQEEQRKQEREFHEEQLKLQREEIAKLFALKQEADAPGTNDQAAGHGQSHRNFNVKPPQLLEKEATLAHFHTWKETWEDYYNMNNVDKLPREKQLATFRSFLSNGMRATLTQVIGVPEHTEDDPLTVTVLLDLIQAHFRSKRNIALDWSDFYKRVQKEGEDFDSYLVAIKNIARDAELCNICLDRHLAARVMSGINDEETALKLLALRPFPTFQEASDLCRAEESAKKGNKEMTKSTKSICQVNKSSKGRRYNSPPPKSRNANCYSCGRDSHPRDQCPAKDSTCNKCGRKGHFAKVCRSRSNPEDEPGTKSAGAITIRSSQVNRSAPKAVVTFRTADGKSYFGNYSVLPDTGADASIAGTDFLSYLNYPRDFLEPPPKERIVAANKKPMKCIGTMITNMDYGSRTTKDAIYICEEASGALLSWYACVALGIIPEDYAKGKVPAAICGNQAEPKESKQKLAQKSRFKIPHQSCGPEKLQ